MLIEKYLKKREEYKNLIMFNSTESQASNLELQFLKLGIKIKTL